MCNLLVPNKPKTFCTTGSFSEKFRFVHIDLEKVFVQKAFLSRSKVNKQALTDFQLECSATFCCFVFNHCVKQVRI